MSDPIHQRDISQSTLVLFKFISYFNSHFYTSIVIVTHEPFAFTPSERGKYSQGMCRWEEATVIQVKRGDKLANHLGGVLFSIKHDRCNGQLLGDDL